ncbi:SAM-dependent methyltransferase [Methylocystis suflitae]|uniref:SAM-dependent methyltransferase n=1 Tax=Methylocystis suflitae TaxID=2951405 RepID=UPI002108DE94|nr:methyltransferase domain-containing protein [Methylocystis suflitae]MCQ4189910.1 methyltransferase domain-containing protein [Methylocystis suflitae]
MVSTTPISSSTLQQRTLPAGTKVAPVNKAQRVARTVEAYYDSEEADEFYLHIWGGEDIHIGLYESAADTIANASRRTVAAMADEIVMPLDEKHVVLDIGSGFGGPARYLAKRFGSRVVCLNISEVENERNRKTNCEQGIDHLISVCHGSFENIPAEDASIDLVWSQDAILHSADRERVIAEVSRVLKPGGELVFTDPMQVDDCPPKVLQAVYDRIHLDSLASLRFYRATTLRHGFAEVSVQPMPNQLRNHYAAVQTQLKARYEEMIDIASREYVDRMLIGLKNWLEAADQGYLDWGILHFQKR